MGLYYTNGLYAPLVVYSLFNDGTQLLLISGWFVAFLLLLLRIHGPTGPTLIGYFLALWFAVEHTTL
jgi:hypothetical protein